MSMVHLKNFDEEVFIANFFNNLTPKRWKKPYSTKTKGSNSLDFELNGQNVTRKISLLDKGCKEIRFLRKEC